MSLYLRLVIGPVVVCDVELFGTAKANSADDPPAQLAGGSGAVLEAEDASDATHFGFC